jgi:hypothetical protein
MDTKLKSDISPDLLLAVTHTVKTLSRISESIQWHQARTRPDTMAIEQWQEVHADLTQQLVAMLAEAGVNVQVPTKTLEHA